MTLNMQRLRAHGFLDDEIRQIQEYCDAAEQAGRFNRVIALIRLNGELGLCCTTIAEIFEQLRPGSWLNRPGGEYQEVMALKRQVRKKVQRQKYRPLRKFFK